MAELVAMKVIGCD